MAIASPYLPALDRGAYSITCGLPLWIGFDLTVLAKLSCALARARAISLAA